MSARVGDMAHGDPWGVCPACGASLSKAYDVKRRPLGLAHGWPMCATFERNEARAFERWVEQQRAATPPEA